MTTTPDSTLPLEATYTPATAEELSELVREAAAQQMALYPIGGGTSLDYGLPARQPGWGVHLTQLNQVVDYPARDMTITVQAGLTMQSLADELAAHRQRIPLDVPARQRATIGGVVATDCSGALRCGHGTARDYVIGISAVDGRGETFRGGGRVVKNVAGYDFCKLLTGSLGTLGIISQLTLKVKPQAERQQLLAATMRDDEQLETLLADLVESELTPVAVEVVGGAAWTELFPDADRRLVLLVGFEGSEDEVDWLARQWRERLQAEQADVCYEEGDAAAEPVWSALAEFPQQEASPLVLRAQVVPSATVTMLRAFLREDPSCSIQAHADNGVVTARFRALPDDGLSRTLVGRLQPAAAAGHGHVVLLSNPSGNEMTHQSVWGIAQAPPALLNRIKNQFDPQNLLNPGRFVV